MSAARRFRARHPRLTRFAIAGAVLVALVFALFISNGMRDAHRAPDVGVGSGALRAAPLPELRVMAFNLAKCDFHHGGLSFDDAAVVRATLERVALALERENCDVVCLSEVVFEAAPTPVNQAEYLALRCGYPTVVGADNYSFGLPFCRIRSGNALLARVPLTACSVEQLTGTRPFWAPTNNRRVLWCELELNGAPLLVASVRNDSFDIANNLRQTERLLARIGERPALLAGDFNAEPSSAPLARLRATEHFIGFDDVPTFPARAATRRIDYVLAPNTWTLIEQHVVDIGTSDHLAVVATFRLP